MGSIHRYNMLWVLCYQARGLDPDVLLAVQKGVFSVQEA